MVCTPNTPAASYGVAGVNSYLATGANVPKMPVATGTINASGGYNPSSATITGPGYEYIVSSAGLFNLGAVSAFPNYPAASANANSLGGPCVAPGTGVQAKSVMTWRHHMDDTAYGAAEQLLAV